MCGSFRGVSFPQGRSGAAAGGAGQGSGLVPAVPVHGDRVPAWGGSCELPLPQPLSLYPQEQREATGRVNLNPSHALGFARGPWAQRDTFLCTQATVPSALGCSRQGSQQQRAPGLSHPLSLCRRGSQPQRPGASGSIGTTARGHHLGPSWVLRDGAARGVLELPLGMRVLVPRGVPGATSASGSRERFGMGPLVRVCPRSGSLDPGGGCRGVSATSLSPPMPGPGSRCHVL